MRLVSLLVACAALPAALATSQAAQDKLADLNSQTSHGASLLMLTDANFERFVTDPDRSFHMFVLFNAPSGQFKCDVCAPAQDELAVTAASYATEVAASGLGEGQKPAFFGVAMFNTNRNAFGKVRLLNTVACTSCHPANNFRISAIRVAAVQAERCTAASALCTHREPSYF